MQIEFHEQKKLVVIWLSSAEKSDMALMESLKPLYASYQKQGYLTAVFLSGREDLYEETRDLLLYNRKRSAEIAVQRKEQTVQAVHS